MKKLDQKDVEYILGLTPMQAGMLFLYLKNPGSDYYFEQLSLSVTGALEFKFFEQAWNFVIDTNEMLRAVFRWENVEHPLQIILKNNQIKPKYYDFSREKPREKKKKLEVIKREDREKKFDLREVPFRVTLVKIEEYKYEIIISNHHIIYDGWSNGIILKEFFNAYYALTRGKELIRPIKTKFKEFINWIQDRDIKEEKNFWNNYLIGFNTPKDLSIKRRNGAEEITADRYRVRFPRDMKVRIDHFIKKQKITMAALLYTAWGLLLQKYNGHDDVIFGTTISGRPVGIRGIENIVGLFINTVPLRLKTDRKEKINDLLCKVDKTLQIRKDFEAAPPVIIKECSEIDDKGKLFDNIVIIENYPLNLKRQLMTGNGNLSIDSYTMVEMSDYDLTIEFMILDTLDLTFTYKSVFTKNSIARLSEHFRYMVENILENPLKELSEIDILSKEEKNKLLNEFNNTAANFPRDKTIHELFEEQAARTPDSIALVGLKSPVRGRASLPETADRVRITYQYSDEKSHRLAHLLRKKGVKPDAIVGIMMGRSIEMIVGILGILKAGGTYLPVDPDYPEERIRYMLNDTDAEILLTTRQLQKKNRIDVKIKRFYLEQKEFCQSVAPFIDLRNTNHPRDMAYVIYTSGTTGKPKGSLIEHRNVVRLMVNDRFRFDFSQKDVWTLFHSFCFDFSVWEMYGALLYGGKLLIIPKIVSRNTNSFLEILREESVTILNQTPAAFYNLIELELNLFNGFDDSMNDRKLNIRYVILGGEVLKPARLKAWKERYPQTCLVNMYGITETTVHVTYREIKNEDIVHNISNIGKPLHTLNTYVMDYHLKLMPVGTHGECCIGGDGVGRGYLNKPELTKEKFVQNPYKHEELLYKSGDRVKLSEEGEMEYLGRIDHQVKIRGFRIELEEIENQLLNHEKIKEAVVMARENENSGKYLCAYVVTAVINEGEQANILTELREYLSGKLPGYMIPSYFVSLSKIPLKSNGKVDRSSLPEPLVKIRERYTAPAKGIEETLTKIWSEVLGIEKIGVNDNFFQLGGDSIKVIQVTSKLLKYKLKVDINELYLNPTIAGLKKYARPINPAVDQQAVEGEVELTPIQRWFFTYHSSHHHHFNQSMMITGKNRFDKAAVEEVFTRILQHHDALRSRFRLKCHPLKQVIESHTGKPVHLELLDLTGKDKKNIPAEIEKEGNRIQKEIDLETGPLMKLLLFRNQTTDHLLIVIHHLVVDGISWRILLEDFASGYLQAVKGDEVKFQEKTCSFKTWSHQLKRYAESKDVLETLAYWKALEETKFETLPKDFELAPDDRRFGNCRTITVGFNNKETQWLLKKVNRVYNTTINDILLTALGMAIADWKEIKSIIINLEGHGREAIFKEIDISRTIGWFTSQFPVHLDLSGIKNTGTAIMQVKEILKRIPGKGISYGILRYLTPEEKKEGIKFQLEPEISFNYLGQFDQGYDSQLFNITRMNNGNTVSPYLERKHLIDINGMVMNGKFSLSFSYNRYEYKRTSMKRLAQDYKDNLKKIIRHCLKKPENELTPSGLYYLRLTIAKSEDLKNRTNKQGKKIENIYQLSPMQLGMLFHYLKGKKSPVYFEQILLSIEGVINLGLWEKSFNILFERYDILRTVFLHEKTAEPLQVVTKHRHQEVYFEDITYLKEYEKKPYIEKFGKRDIEKGFNLAEDTLMRIFLFKTGRNSYKLIWSYHHIIMDGWSLGNLFTEFLTIYRGLIKKEVLNLKPAIQYKKYIEWLVSKRKDEGLRYWKEYLEGYDRTATLPKLGPSANEGTTKYKLEEFIFVIPKEFIESLKQIAKRNQVTFNTLLQTLWGILLQKYNNTDDVVFGAVVSGRSSEIEGSESMVGLLINTIPVRMQTGTMGNFSQLLKIQQEKAVRSKSYEYLPLAEVQSNSLLKMHLIDHTMVFENYPVSQRLLDNDNKQDVEFEIKSLETHGQSSYEFSFILIPGRDFTVKFSFSALVYQLDVVKKIALHFKEIARQVMGNPHIDIKEISMISAEEKAQLLYEFSGNNIQYPMDKTINELFEEKVKEFPGKVFLVFKDKQLTYRELNRCVNRLAGLLRRKGVKSDHIVGIITHRSIEMVVGILGIMKAGGAYLPVDPQYPETRKRYMLKDSDAKVVVLQEGLLESHEYMSGDIGLSSMISLGDEGRYCRYSGPDPGSGISCKPGSLAYVIYTSGSTGVPKGVLIEHRAIINMLFWRKNYYQFNEKDVVLQMPSFSFDGSVADIFTSLISASVLVIIRASDRFDPGYLGELIVSRKVTHFTVIPSLYKTYLEEIPGSLPGMRTVTITAESCPEVWVEKHREKLNHVTLYNEYGPTENSVCTTAYEFNQKGTRVLIGKPIYNTSCYILDRSGKLIPILAAGELYIFGAGLGRGYLNGVEITAEKFIKNPYMPGKQMYRTGDLARWMLDGNIEFLGRIDQQVKIRGHRIELGEIQNHLLKHDKVKEAVVVAGEDNCAAYIVSEEGTGASELKEFLSNRLPSYMVPGYFMRLEKIPLTPNGKVDRQALPNPVFFSADSEKTYVKPQDDVEKVITDIWQKVLKLDRVGVHDNFFDIGGNSIKIITLMNRLKKALDIDIPITALFKYSTVASLAGYLVDREVHGEVHSEKGENNFPGKRPNQDIERQVAIIGMACRFPGASNIEAFWNNLVNGIESISFFSDEELAREGIGPDLLKNPNYIKAKGILKDAEYFDFSFFDYPGREARIMEPQLRILHECSWEALENAGYSPDKFGGSIGFYTGATYHFLWLSQFFDRESHPSELFHIGTLNNCGSFATLISYKLNLKGPAIFVNTTCSTSLAAVHMACKGLLNGECHMAMAGGISFTPPARSGYLYEEGMIFSPDGHCRAFDADAGGTIGGNGVGLVVLKPLVHALDDGDTIYAVIKVSALNNDGKRKLGYMAPSIEGQAEVIRAALDAAGVEAESITYVEAHGTGTPLGDPVEFEALKSVFGTSKKKSCGLGSVKTNIGHLDAASGIAGLIKTALAIKNRQIPPGLHFKKINPKIDIENSPFYIVSGLTQWISVKYPLRAGVSSFGVGGTNAHVIMEEAPRVGKLRHASPGRRHKLIMLSAKTGTALKDLTSGFLEYLKKNPDVNLADAAYTLQVGRSDFPYRKITVCPDRQEVIRALSGEDGDILTALAGDDKKHLVFMFPGQGSQYVNMGLDLYREEPVFREEMDRCFKILKPLMGYDIKEILYPGETAGKPAHPAPSFLGPLRHGITRTEIAQPVLFVFEYALAKLLIKWGIKPYAMIGHSIGEYTAACLASVFSLEEGLRIVAVRGKLMQRTPAGAMLGVPVAEKTLKRLLPASISLAAVNGPSQCVVSGSGEAVEAFKTQLEEHGHQCHLLHTSHAFHSPIMDPLLREFDKKISQIKLNEPQVPYISNLTGGWITARDALDPAFWTRHLRQTVRFADGVKELLKKENSIFVEVGPGKTLSAFVRKNANKEAIPGTVCLVRHPEEKIPGSYFLLKGLGQLWLYGRDIDWKEFYREEKRVRIPLPSYPFEKKHCGSNCKAGMLPDEAAPGNLPFPKEKDMEDWFYIPSWKRSQIPDDYHNDASIQLVWLVFMDEYGLGEHLVKRLEQVGADVVMVRKGPAFSRESDKEYRINCSQDTDYHQLIRDLRRANRLPGRILHLWGVYRLPQEEPGLEQVNQANEMGFYSVLYLVQAIGRQESLEMKLVVITDNLFLITGEERYCPVKAPVIGLLKVIPQEYPHIDCVNIDILLPEPGTPGEEELIDLLVSDIAAGEVPEIIAYRNNYRWVQVFEPKVVIRRGQPLAHLKEKGTYLVTGGLGRIGLALAGYLARSVKARLVLTGRSGFPANRACELDQLKEWGGEVLVLKADVADPEAMAMVIRLTEQRFGPLNGVIHAAGVTREESFRIINQTDKVRCEEQFRAKLYGTLVLEKLLQGKKLDFCLLMSSLSSILGGVRTAAYAAANAFMDAFAQKNKRANRGGWRSLNWDGWNFGENGPLRSIGGESSALGIKPEEGLAAFEQILSINNTEQVLISTMDLQSRLNRRGKFELLLAELPGADVPSLTSRPDLATPYVPPRSPLEKKLSGIWEKFLGFDRVGINDNFFDLGITSLEIVHINSKVKEALGREIPVVLWYEYPTIKNLAGYLLQEKQGEFDGNEKALDVKSGQAEMISKGKNKLKQMKKVVSSKG